MLGIYIAAILTSLLAAIAFGSLVLQITPKPDCSLVLVLTICGLPLSVSTYYLVRLPIDRGLEKQLGKESSAYTAARLCYAPVTEEPAKLLPLLLLLLPPFRGHLTRDSVVAIGMALGLGFAIGEMWLVAHFIAADPKLGAFPFYMYGGYIGERLQTCLTHSGFTVLAVWGLRRGWGWFIVGLSGGMVLHFLGNFPIYLMRQDAWGLGKDVWSQIVGVWVALFSVGALVLLGLIYFGPTAAKKLLTAKVLCPDCGQLYRQPIFGMNMGMKRYEQCPLCKKWHWIDIRDMLKNDPPAS